MSEALQVVRRYFSGHSADVLAADAEFRDMTSPGTAIHGPEAVARFLSSFYGSFERSGATINQMHGAGDDTAVVEFTFWGENQQTPLGPIPATGRDATVPMCAVYTVRNGQIVAASIYYNAAAFQGQLAG